MVHEQHSENLRDIVLDLAELGELDNAVSLLLNRHPADQADLMEGLDESVRLRLLPHLSPAQLAGLLEYLSEDVRSRLLREFSAGALAPVLNHLDQDVAADIVQGLPAPQAEAVVPMLRESEAVAELLAYTEDSAGGRMSRQFVALRRDWTVEASIEFLRLRHLDVAHPFYLYVIDDSGRLTGVVALRSMVTAAPETPIAAIMANDVVSVEATADQEAAAERMRHYNLLALPVVDEDNRLLGVISADDVLDVQVEEATEDMFKMAGVGVKEHAFSPALESAGRRVPWLAFNMVWAFAGAAMISAFEGTLERAAFVAVFMPMIAGQCGNAGIQTATIVVRSMALGEIGEGVALRLLRKEWLLGAIKGTLFGSILALVAWLWKGNAILGLVAGGAMFLNMLVAATAGVVVPLTLRRIGIDPATIAGVFDTMLTDFMGFFIYLGLATLFISSLT